MRILITGATGFVGRYLLPELLREDNQVWAVVRNANKNLPDEVGQLVHDLQKPLETTDFPEEVDAIIHLAQSEHFRNFPERANNVFYTNIVSTQHLLDYAQKIGAKQFTLASSGGVYGNNELAFTENDSIGFQDELGFYLGTKLCSEVLASSYESLFNVTTLRFFFVYGSGQRETMLMPRLINSVRNGNPINIQGTHGIKINPIHVSDAAIAIKKALQYRASAKINIGGLETVCLRELCEKIGKIVGHDPVFDINETVEPRHLIGDIDKMKCLLHTPQVTLEEGLLNTIYSKGLHALK